MPFRSTQHCYGMFKPNPRVMLSRGLLSEHVFCLNSGSRPVHDSRTCVTWVKLFSSPWCVLLLSHPPCFAFPFILPFTLHAEVRLPRDKPQKAGQEGPVEFGFECGSFGSTRNFVEVLPGREVQGEMKSRALWVPKGHHPPGSALPNIFFLFSFQMHLPSLGLLHWDKRDSLKRVGSHSARFRQPLLPPGINYIPWLRQCSSNECLALLSASLRPADTQSRSSGRTVLQQQFQ